jgi:glycosyltransferase involved in cell wall biosynthesis
VRKLNLHIYFSPMVHESRMFKITQSLISNFVFDDIVIAASKREDLPDAECLMQCVTIRRLGLVRGTGGSIYKALSFIFYCMSVFLFAVRNKPVCVNVHSLTLVPVGLLIKLFSSKTILIYDAHELETETNGSSSTFKFFKRIIERFSIGFFRYCFFVSPSILNWYKDKYGIECASVVMNCPKYLPNINSTNYFREHFGLTDQHVLFLYQGIFAKGRGIESLIRVIDRLPENAVLICLGYGALDDELREKARTNPKLFVHDAVAPAKIFEITPSADCGISFFENTSLSQFYALPNKLFEFGACFLPVIVSPTLDQKLYVEGNHNGIVCGGFSDEDLYNACLEYLSLAPGHFKDAIEVARYKYSWQEQERSMLSVYQSLSLNAVYTTNE